MITVLSKINSHQNDIKRISKNVPEYLSFFMMKFVIYVYLSEKYSKTFFVFNLEIGMIFILLLNFLFQSINNILNYFGNMHKIFCAFLNEQKKL